MRIELTKGPTSDRIDIRRSDGSTACTSFPHKGPVPHDVVHFFVELELGIQMGFWGLVAHGHDPEEIAAMAKVAGHASATRRRVPDPSFVPAIQAERIVECFEADLWAPGSDAATFREAAFTACDQSLVTRVAIEPEKISRIRHQLAAFRRRWEVLPVGSSCRLEWPENPPLRRHDAVRKMHDAAGALAPPKNRKGGAVLLVAAPPSIDARGR